jgi:membrane protein
MKYAVTTFDLLKQTFMEWKDDNAPRLAAALSYYTAFALAPLLIVLISVVGFFFGEEAARGEIVRTLTSELGRDNAEFVENIVDSANDEEEEVSTFATVAGFVLLLAGATGVFGQLQSALNTIWDIQQTPGGFWYTIRRRILSFGMLLVIGFLLLVSLIVSSLIAALDTFLIGMLPSFAFVLQILTFLISFSIITVLFALIYKYLPDAEVAWRDVFIGAAVTSILFNVGRWLLAIYLGRTSTASTYGAAGSLAVFLLWVYYSAQIVLFGAEFTQVYAKRFGSKIIADVAEQAEKAQAEDAVERKIQPIPDERAEPLPMPSVAALELEAQEPEVIVRHERDGWNPKMVFVGAMAFLGGLVGLNFGNNKAEMNSDSTEDEKPSALPILGAALAAASTFLSGLLGWFVGHRRERE